MINALLDQKILPTGIGHTTYCFVTVQGTAEKASYIEVRSTNADTKASISKNEANEADRRLCTFDNVEQVDWEGGL